LGYARLPSLVFRVRNINLRKWFVYPKKKEILLSEAMNLDFQLFGLFEEWWGSLTGIILTILK
jgi:hypothetical protein